MNQFAKRGKTFTIYDKILAKFWIYVFPRIILIPILFYGMKKLLIDWLYASKGFEITIIYLAIIIVIRPLIMDAILQMFKLRNDIKKDL